MTLHMLSHTPTGVIPEESPLLSMAKNKEFAVIIKEFLGQATLSSSIKHYICRLRSQLKGLDHGLYEQKAQIRHMALYIPPNTEPGTASEHCGPKKTEATFV